MFGFGIDQGGMSISGRPYPFIYSFVTGNFFSALGVTPALGRVFQPGEGENPGAESSLVLGYSFWQKHLGGRPDIIGQEIRLNGESARVIGVAPPEFHGAYEVEVWTRKATCRSAPCITPACSPTALAVRSPCWRA